MDYNDPRVARTITEAREIAEDLGCRFDDSNESAFAMVIAATVKRIESLNAAVRYLWAAWSEAEGDGQPEAWVFGPRPDMRAYYTDNDVRPSHDPSKFSEWHEAPANVQAVIRELLGKR